MKINKKAYILKDRKLTLTINNAHFVYNIKIFLIFLVNTIKEFFLIKILNFVRLRNFSEILYQFAIDPRFYY